MCESNESCINGQPNDNDQWRQLLVMTVNIIDNVKPIINELIIEWRWRMIMILLRSQKMNNEDIEDIEMTIISIVLRWPNWPICERNYYSDIEDLENN